MASIGDGPGNLVDISDAAGLRDNLNHAIATIQAVRSFTCPQKKKSKRGPAPISTSNRLYLLPDGSPLPYLSKRPPSQLILTHQRTGYGYPAALYVNDDAQPVRMLLDQSDEEHQKHMEQLWPKLIGKRFQMFTIDNNRTLHPLLPNHPSALKPHKGNHYRGTVIIRMVSEELPATEPQQINLPEVAPEPSSTRVHELDTTHAVIRQAQDIPTSVVITSAETMRPASVPTQVTVPMETQTVTRINDQETTLQPGTPRGQRHPPERASQHVIQGPAQMPQEQARPLMSTPAGLEMPPSHALNEESQIAVPDVSVDSFDDDTVPWNGLPISDASSDIIQLGRQHDTPNLHRQNVIEVQNREYFSSLAIDRQKDMEKSLARLRRRQERTRRRLERERKEEDRQMLRVRRLADLGDEPADEEGFLVIFKNGEEELRRRFLPSSLQKDLYFFIEGHTDVIEPKLRLGTQVIQCTSSTLQSVGIDGPCRIHVEETYEVIEDEEGSDTDEEPDQQEPKIHDTLTDRETCRIQTLTFLTSHAKHKLRLSRNCVLQQVVDYYTLHPDVVHHRLEVEFEGEEQAVDLDGITKEMFTLFFAELMTTQCEGDMEKVPKMTAGKLSTNFWTTVGRIISHAYVMYGLFPINLSFASVCAAITGKVSESALFDSFVNFLPETDRLAIQKGLDHNMFPSVKNRLIHILSSSGGENLPTCTNLKEEILNVANLRMVCSPIYPFMQIKQGLDCHGILWCNWHEDTLQELYQSLSPNGQKVVDSISYEFSDDLDLRILEEVTMNHLEQFVNSLSKKDVSQMLVYWTSLAYTIPQTKLVVNFNSSEGLAIRPTAMTCSSTLTLSRNYMSYAEFATNLNDYIFSGQSLSFDSI